MKNNLEILEELIGINSRINYGLFSETSFLDKKLENIFFQEKNKYPQKVFSDVMLILGYLISLLHIISAFYRKIFLLYFLVFFSVCLLLIFFSYRYSKEKRIISVLDNLQIFLISLNLNLKAVTILLNINNEGIDDISRDIEELLRLIIYDFITSNLLLLVKLEGNFLTHLFYLLMNLLTITLCQVYIEKNHYFYLEGITSFMFSTIFYFFRKIWDYRIRITFSEKYKFENLFIYTNDFLQGLNGYHLNFSNDLSIYYDNKFNNFLYDNLFDEEYNMKENKYKDEPIISKLNNNNIKIKNNENFINSEKNHLDNNLAFYNDFKLDKDNIKTTEKIKSENKNLNTFNNDNFLEETDKDLIIKNQQNDKKDSNSFKLLNKENFLNNNSSKQNKENINFKKTMNRNEIIKDDSINLFNHVTFFLSEFKRYFFDKNIKENDILNPNSNTPYPNSSFVPIKDSHFMNINFNSNSNKEELSYYQNQEKTKIIGNYNKNKVEYIYEENKNINLLSQIKYNIENPKQNKKINENIYLGVYMLSLEEKKIREENFKSILNNSKDPLTKKKYCLKKEFVQEKNDIIIEEYSPKHLDIVTIQKEMNRDNNDKSDKSQLISCNNKLDCYEYNKNISNLNEIKKNESILREFNNKYTNFNSMEKNIKKIKFFDVYYRRINLSNDNIIYNIIFYDVTDLINSRITIDEENKLKHKVLAKMAHEFKTPLTSIICLVSKLLSSYRNNSENNKIDGNNICNTKISKKIKKIKNELQHSSIDTLNLIKNLSEYVIFLTSDIINYSNPKNINDIQLNNQNINLKEISEFCFDILKSLLYCNYSKFEKIKPELIFDDSLDYIQLYSDEFRIKQILLNFISNSVKFTNEGFIKLNFSKCGVEKNLINISLEDSGIGIREENQFLLFRDFSNLEKNYNINSLINANVGSGLGLSICKNLSDKLKMKITLESVYGKGTKIGLNIDYENFEMDLNLSNRYSIQSNMNDFDFISINNKIETKRDKNFSLNVNKETRKKTSLKDSFKQGFKYNNDFSNENLNNDDSFNENDFIIKKSNIKNKVNNDANQEENDNSFKKLTNINSSRFKKNVYSDVDASQLKSNYNKIFVNNIYQIKNNIGENINEKFYNSSFYLDNNLLENIKKKYNFEIVKNFEEPFSDINITKINFLKDDITCNEGNKNNLNKYRKSQKFLNNYEKIKDKQNISSLSLNNEEKNCVIVFF